MSDAANPEANRKQPSYGELKQENEYLWYAVIVFFLLWII